MQHETSKCFQRVFSQVPMLFVMSSRALASEGKSASLAGYMLAQ